MERRGIGCFRILRWHRYVQRLAATPGGVQGVLNLVQPRLQVLSEEWLGEIPVVPGYLALSVGLTIRGDRADLGS